MPTCLHCGRTQATAEVKRAYRYSVRVVIAESFVVEIASANAADAEQSYRSNGLNVVEIGLPLEPTKRTIRSVNAQSREPESCGYVCRDVKACLARTRRC